MKSEVLVLKVLFYGETIGTLTHLPGDKNLFSFERSYIDNLSRAVLSLSFKDREGELIKNIPITQTRLPPFFSNLLPEGPLKEYLAKQANIDPNHEFFLLSLLGKDLPGALTVEPVENFSLFSHPVSSKKRNNGSFHFSLAGVQLKFSAIQKGDQWIIPKEGVGGKWIVKLPHAIFPKIPENEYSMMELARQVGIDVPPTALYPLKQLHELPEAFMQPHHQVFAIQRFDRTETGEKIHIEDFAQVFGVYPEKKYKSASYRNIAAVIYKEAGASGAVEFIRRFVFNALIGNGDMHLKNWSLIYKNKVNASLAPAYDFISTIPYIPGDQLALNFVDSKEFQSLTLEQFKRFARKTELPEDLVLSTVQETTELFAKRWKRIGDLPLEENVRLIISNHLKTIPFFKPLHRS